MAWRDVRSHLALAAQHLTSLQPSDAAVKSDKQTKKQKNKKLPRE